MIMLPIVAGQQGVLVINVFTVRPENQGALVDCIRDAGDPADIPGLVGMHLLRSEDGTRVINHMHWTSERAFRAATGSNPVIEATRARVTDLIDSRLPDPYEVVPLTR